MWIGHVERMGQKGNSHIILMGNHEVEGQL
jgi:hypothetical protein